MTLTYFFQGKLFQTLISRKLAQQYKTRFSLIVTFAIECMHHCDRGTSWPWPTFSRWKFLIVTKLFLQICIRLHGSTSRRVALLDTTIPQFFSASRQLATFIDIIYIFSLLTTCPEMDDIFVIKAFPSHPIICSQIRRRIFEFVLRLSWNYLSPSLVGR